MKKILRTLLFFAIFVSTLGPLGCIQQPASSSTLPPGSNTDARPEKKYEDLIVGFAQLGAESEWRAGRGRRWRRPAECARC